MVKVVTTLLLLMYLISTCIAANNRRDDDENMPGLHGNESLRTKAHIAHGTVISIAIVLFFSSWSNNGPTIFYQEHFMVAHGLANDRNVYSPRWIWPGMLA